MKELNLYEATLRQLLSEKYLSNVLGEQYSGLDPHIVEAMKTKIMDIVSNRLKIEPYNKSC